MAILNEASIIINIPAPTHKAGSTAMNISACGINTNPIEAKIAPAKKKGFLLPNRPQVLSL